MKSVLMMLAVCAALARCSSDTAPPTTISHRIAKDRERIRAAAELTSRYRSSRFAQWHIQADAAGALCNVLVIRTPVVMETTMVDAMHRGAGEYALGDRNVKTFYVAEAFRGVAYCDGSGRVWTYGAVTEAEVEELAPCR